MAFNPWRHKNALDMSVGGVFILALLWVAIEASSLVDTVGGEHLAGIGFVVGSIISLVIMVSFRTNLNRALLWFHRHHVIVVWLVLIFSGGAMVAACASFLNRLISTTPMVERLARIDAIGYCRGGSASLTVSTSETTYHFGCKVREKPFQVGQRVVLSMQKGILGFWRLKAIQTVALPSNRRIDTDRFAADHAER